MKWLKSWAALVVSILLCVETAFASEFSGTAGSDDIDIVIMIDTSGSMLNSDPERLAVEGAKLFTSLIQSHGSRNSVRIGVIPFSTQLGQIIPLTDDNSEADSLVLCGKINQITYEDSDTDIGLALKKGVSMLEEDFVSNKKAILLFTDGKIEVNPVERPADSEGIPADSSEERTTQDSEQDVEDALQEIGKQYPVYTIGLNSNGEVDQSFLKSISDETGGETYLIDAYSDLNDMFVNIYSNMVGSDLPTPEPTIEVDGEARLEFEVPDSYVLQANIILYPDEPANLRHIELSDPFGKPVEIDGKNASFMSSKSYILLKLYRPAMGTWTETVYGHCTIKPYFIYSRDVVLELRLDDKKTYTAGDEITAAALLDSDQGEVINTDFVSRVWLAVTDPHGNVAEYEMVQANRQYTGKFKTSDPGIYTIQAKASGDNFDRTTTAQTLEVKKASVQETTTVQTAALETLEGDSQDSPKWPKTAGIAIVAVCILTIIGIVFLFTRKRRGKKSFFGQIEYSIEYELASGSYLKDTCWLSGYKGSVRLDRLIVSPDRKLLELDKIVLRPYYDLTENINGITIENKSAKMSCAGYAGASGIRLLDGEECRFERDLGDGGMVALTIKYQEMVN